MYACNAGLNGILDFLCNFLLGQTYLTEYTDIKVTSSTSKTNTITRHMQNPIARLPPTDKKNYVPVMYV